MIRQICSWAGVTWPEPEPCLEVTHAGTELDEEEEEEEEEFSEDEEVDEPLEDGYVNVPLDNGHDECVKHAHEHEVPKPLENTCEGAYHEYYNVSWASHKTTNQFVEHIPLPDIISILAGASMEKTLHLESRVTSLEALWAKRPFLGVCLFCTTQAKATKKDCTVDTSVIVTPPPNPNKGTREWLKDIKINFTFCFVWSVPRGVGNYTHTCDGPSPFLRYLIWNPTGIDPYLMSS